VKKFQGWMSYTIDEKDFPPKPCKKPKDAIALTRAHWCDESDKEEEDDFRGKEKIAIDWFESGGNAGLVVMTPDCVIYEGSYMYTPGNYNVGEEGQITLKKSVVGDGSVILYGHWKCGTEYGPWLFHLRPNKS
jgi:hypothetical protein